MTEIRKTKKKKSPQVQILTAFLLVFDVVSVLFSWFFALWIRHDCLFRAIPESYLSVYQHTILLYAGLCVILFAVFKLYRSLWQFASYMELLRLFIASAIAFITYLTALTIKGRHMPVSYYIFGLTTQVILTLGVRFFYRFVTLLYERSGRKKCHKHIMIIGAGRAGQMILRDVNSAGCDEEVCCYMRHQILCLKI